MSEPRIEWRKSTSIISRGFWLYIDDVYAGEVHQDSSGLFPYAARYEGVGVVYCHTEEQAKSVMELWAMSEGVKGE